uniref:Uncharacterized protein n=1 Tax=Arundo donax TaxID=35708 RepID=A0A0A9C4N3_ARUDO
MPTNVKSYTTSIKSTTLTLIKRKYASLNSI